MPEEVDAIDEELLAAIARIKGHPVQKAIPQPVSVIYPLSTAAWEATWKNPVPGRRMPDGTVYLGKYSPRNREGESLCLEFNVFAAREDLPDGPRTYEDTLKHIAELKGWNGYDGAGYANDIELNEVLKNGAYKGGWIIPTRDILGGKDTDGRETTPDNICAHMEEGAFRDTFQRATVAGDARPASYWSCNEDRACPDYIYGIRLTDGGIDWDLREGGRMSCRPVRLMPVLS